MYNLRGIFMFFLNLTLVNLCGMYINIRKPSRPPVHRILTGNTQVIHRKYISYPHVILESILKLAWFLHWFKKFFISQQKLAWILHKKLGMVLALCKCCAKVNKSKQKCKYLQKWIKKLQCVCIPGNIGTYSVDNPL